MKTFTFMRASRGIMLRIRNVLDKRCRGNQNTRLIFNNFFPKVVPFTRPRAHSLRNRLLLSHGNNGFANAS